MKFLQKRWVAVTLAVLMVVAAIGIGQVRGRMPEAAPAPGLNYGPRLLTVMRGGSCR